MFQLKATLFIVALACYLSRSEASGIKSYTRSWTLSPTGASYLKQGTLFIADSHDYPYAVCETTEPKKEISCKVTVISENKRERSCDGVKVFAGEGRQLFLGGFFQLIPFTKDHIIVGWYDDNGKDNDEKKSYFKISILDTVKCTTANLEYPIDKVAYGFFPAMVLYENQIDVIVNSKATCAGAKSCRLSYHLNGKQIGGIKSYNSEFSGYANPVSPKSPSKGYFQYVKDLESIRLLLVNDAGVAKELLKVSLESEAVSHLDVFNNAHELYSVCRMPNFGDNKPTKVSCVQFDGTGKKKLSTSIDLDESASWISSRNLADGGLVLATAGCSKASSGNEKCKHFVVRKLKADGKSEKSLKLKTPDQSCYNKDNGLELRISENEKGEYCFDFSCLKSNVDLKYNSICVSKDKL